jgi:cytochrome c biogenesis protein CcmG, thiol:disulfide interchange protein DsbE
MRHEAADNIPAPRFQARDLNGHRQGLDDHRGEVVLVNVWATWCVHCLSEMPKLDRLFREHQNEGLMVFGLSNEDSTIQRKGLTNVQVTYPLLTHDGRIPALYRYIVVYPTTFVIDRRGILQPAISGDQFDKLESTVIDLLNRKPY